MAKVRGVWGIDIGQSALKALRCTVDQDNRVVADTYDYIEYPKILSLPDADEELLVKDAMDTFLGRNELRGDFVAMCVSGQLGLSRFFKPPPVDARTLPDIVKYEVKQQIPFPIEDVIWDWQSLGGTEMDNVIVDAEVGLFAIKRDTVFTALQPFLRSDLEVDLIQLAPLATHNVICHELLEEIPSMDELDLDNLPNSVVVLSMGTDATDLIVSNGIKLWLRNVPIGGNHFTKQLSRELKLTHAKAEHLKRNARQAEDPKTIFQAMRPVFNDLVTEVQRSLSYFSGMEKNANIEKIVLLGNAARLPGLRQYLNKQLNLDIAKVNQFGKLTGPVVEERAFQENLLSFAPCYGLCLQGLELGAVKTNLLPNEFVTERLIRAKKPWVLASVSLLMLGMLFSYFFVNQRWWGVSEEFAHAGVSWKQALQQVQSKTSLSARFVNDDIEQKSTLDRINMISSELSEASETQSAWPELIAAVVQILPRDPRLEGKLVANPSEIPFEDRFEMYIDHVESKYEDDLSRWVDNKIIDLFRDQQGITVEGPKIVVEVRDGVRFEKTVTPPAEYDIRGPGWVVEIKAHHFYNSKDKRDKSLHGSDFVKKHFLDQLVTREIKLPGADGKPELFKFEDIGVYYPTLIQESPLYEVEIPNPNYDPNAPASSSAGSSEPPADGDEGAEGTEKKPEPEFFYVQRYDFTIQFAFIPTSVEQRIAARADRLKQESRDAASAPQSTQSSAPAVAPANQVANAVANVAPQPNQPANENASQPPADNQKAEDPKAGDNSPDNKAADEKADNAKDSTGDSDTESGDQ